MAIWLQFDDPSTNDSEFQKIIYQDEQYEEALEHYEDMKDAWKRTRILFENNDDTHDWVVVQDDSGWKSEG